MCKKAYMEANFSTSFSGGKKWLESLRRLREMLFILAVMVAGARIASEGFASIVTTISKL